MADDTIKGMQELFATKPELFAEVKALVETTHNFLYDGAGESNDHIDICNECIPAIIEAARELPELQVWVKQLDDFKKTEYAKRNSAA